MPTAMSRRKTLPMDRSESKQLFDFIESTPKIKQTLPERHTKGNSGLSTLPEGEVITSWKDRPRTSLKRNDSYRKATQRLSIYEDSQEAEAIQGSFHRESYDARKYRTLPKDMGSLERPANKKKNILNNNNNNEKGKVEKREYHRENSGHVPSPDSDDEETVPTKLRKKKSTFQRAKDRIIETFRRQKNSYIGKKERKDKVKKQNKKRITKRRSSSIEELEIIGDSGHSVIRLSRSVEDRLIQDRTNTDLDKVLQDDHMTSRTSSLVGQGIFKTFRESVRRKFSSAPTLNDDKSRTNSNDSTTHTRNPPQRPEGTLTTSDTSAHETTINVIEAFLSQNEDSIGNFSRRGSRGRGDRSKLRLDGLVISCPSGSSYTSDYKQHVVTSPTGKVKVDTSLQQDIKVGNHNIVRLDSCNVEVDGNFDDVDGVMDKDFDDVDGFVRSPKTNEGYDVIDGRVHSPRVNKRFDGADSGRAQSPTKRAPGTPKRSNSKNKSPIPFEKLTKVEQNERIQNVASRLARIADQYVSNAESSSDLESPGDGGQRGLNSLEMDLIKSLRSEGDRLSGVFDMPPSVMPFAMELIKEASYNKFQTVIQSSTKGAVGWNEIAMCMYLTKAAVHMAGAGGSLAMKIKDSAVQYLSDRFSKWIIDKGGWESVFEETETDSELD